MIVNRQIGGSGGATASILISGLASTDTVSATTPSSKTITPTWKNSKWCFEKLIEYGTYTITASNGTKTATQNVLIDVATEYDVEMGYRTYLYNYGDECEDVTFGWRRGDYSGGNFTKNTTYITLYNANNWQTCVTTNKISVSSYSTFKVLLNLTSSEGNPKLDLRVCTNSGGDSGMVAHNYVSLSQGSNTVSCDISSLSGDYYLSVEPNATNTSSTKQNIFVYAVWLE